MKIIVSNEEQFDEHGTNIIFDMDSDGHSDYDTFILTARLEKSLRRRYNCRLRDLVKGTSFSSCKNAYKRLENLFFTCLFKEMGVLLKLQKQDILNQENLFSESRISLNETITEIFPEVAQRSGQYDELVTLSEHGIVAGAQVILEMFLDLKRQEKA